MTAVPQLETDQHPVEERQATPGFNYYPLLGVLLALIAAILTYGGLLLLVDDWSLFQFAAERKA